MPVKTMIRCESLTQRLNEPPEPSPGLSEAMPWVRIPHHTKRPERARETFAEFRREDEGIMKNIACRRLMSISHALSGRRDFVVMFSRGIVLAHSAPGCALAAFQAAC